MANNSINYLGGPTDEIKNNFNFARIRTVEPNNKDILADIVATDIANAQRQAKAMLAQATSPMFVMGGKCEIASCSNPEKFKMTNGEQTPNLFAHASELFATLTEFVGRSKPQVAAAPETVKGQGRQG